jgi:hypothetical protein
MLWVVRTDSFDDEVFSRDVGFGYEIDVSFGADLGGSKTLDQEVARLASGVDGEIKHRQMLDRIYKIFSGCAG